MKLTTITPEQRAAFEPYAQRWIQRGWRTGPLTDPEWQQWDAAARACYGYAGVEWHGNVVRVPSPLVGALAAPTAAYLIASRHDAVGGAVHGAVRDAVREVHDAVGDAVREVHDAVREVHDAVHGAVRDAVREVHDAVGDAVRDAVHGAVREVHDAVGDAVDGAVHGAVHGAVREVHDAVGDAVDGAVHDAVHDAVHGAVREVHDEVGQAIRSGWYHRLYGQHWCSWQAYLCAFRDVLGVQLDGDLWDRAAAYETTTLAGWWWPYRDFAMVVDRPVELRLEQVGPTGWGSHRLHCETGPAIAWRDGYALHYWHGTRVPADMIDPGWDAQRILREPNTEIRRCAIERLGWPAFIAQAGLEQVGPTVPDPGNPGQHLALYDVPAAIYDQPVRVLLATNGTEERDGTRHRFGLTTPATCNTPLEAAAWTYGLSASEYANAEVRK